MFTEIILRKGECAKKPQAHSVADLLLLVIFGILLDFSVFFSVTGNIRNYI